VLSNVSNRLTRSGGSTRRAGHGANTEARERALQHRELDWAAWAAHVLRAREDDQRFGAEGAANERAARVYVIDHGEVHGPVRDQSSRVSLSASMFFSVTLGNACCHSTPHSDEVCRLLQRTLVARLVITGSRTGTSRRSAAAMKVACSGHC
jgi:hypothetical protein